MKGYGHQRFLHNPGQSFIQQDEENILRKSRESCGQSGGCGQLHQFHGNSPPVLHTASRLTIRLFSTFPHALLSLLVLRILVKYQSTAVYGLREWLMRHRGFPDFALFGILTSE